MATFDDIWDKREEEYPGLHPDIAAGINLAKQWAAKNNIPLQVTETVRQPGVIPTGGDPNSPHYTGGAADLAWEGLQWGDKNFNGIADHLESQGYSVIRDAHGTGPHIHFEKGNTVQQSSRKSMTFDDAWGDSTPIQQPQPTQEMDASTAPMEDAMLSQMNDNNAKAGIDSWRGKGDLNIGKVWDNASQMAKDYWTTLTAPNPFKDAQYVKDSEQGEGYYMKDGSFVSVDEAGKQMLQGQHNIVDPLAYPLAMIPSPVQPIFAPLAGLSVVDSMRQAYNETDEQGRQQGMAGVGKAIVSPVTGLYDKFIGNPEKFQQDLYNAPAETLFNTALELGVIVAVGKGVYEMRKAKPVAEPKAEFQPSETGPVTRKYTAEDLTPASRQELLDAVKNQLEKIKQQKWDKAEASVEPRPEVVDYTSWWDKNVTRAERGQVDLITRQVLGENGIEPNIPVRSDTAVIDALKKKPYESMFDRAEQGKTDLQTRVYNVLDENGLTPRIPKPTDAQVMNGIKQAQGRAMFDKAEAGKVDVITRQLRELDPYQEWWYDNAERTPERRVAPPAEIADFVDYRDVVQAETNAPSSKIVQELNIRRNGLINDMIQDLKASVQGVEKVRISESDPVMGDTTTALFNLSQNPRWYRDFYKDNKRAPTMADYRAIAEDALNRGIDLQGDRLPPSEHFKALNRTIEAVQKAEMAPDIIKPDSIPKPKEAADMLANYHSDAGNLYDATSMLDKLKGFVGTAKPYEKGSVRAGVSLASDVKKGVIERGIEAGQKAYTDYVDKYSPIQNEVSRFEKETGIKLKPEESPYDLAQVAHTSTARAEMLVRGKTPEEIAALKQHYNLPHDVTMEKVVEQLPKGKLNEFLTKEGFTTVEDAFGGYLVAKRQLELQKLNPDYVSPIETKKAAEFIAKSPVEFHKAAESFYKYNDNLLQIAVDNGLIAPEVAAAIRAKYKNYAAMSRDFSDVSAMENLFGTGRGMVNVQGVLKRLKDGSERSVVNPLESAVKNTYVVLSRVERNKAGKAVADLGELSDGQFFAKKTDAAPDPNKSIFSVYDKGEKTNYQTTPELYRALTAMNEEGISQIVKVLSYPTGWLRAGATLDPGFFAKNVTRDAFTAGVYSKYGFVPVYDTIRGIADIIGNKKLYAEYKASGTPLSVLTGMDRQSMSKAIRSLGKEGMPTPVDVLREITAFFEDATRIREFQKAGNAGEGIVGKTRAAQEVTLNFTQKGAKGTTPNQLIAFFNAQVQGINKLIQEHKTNPVRTATRAATYITAPSIGLWLMNHDDVRYQELPAWQRDLFWIVPTGQKLTQERFNALLKSGKSKQEILDAAGTLIRIPKPFELGIVYGSLPERFLDYAMTKDAKGMKKWANSALEALKPNFMPTVAIPIIEGITNYSFFQDRPIVPRRKEGLPAKLQYSEQNSETAKFLGSQAERFVQGGVSPAKIDNAIAGYLGGLGRTTIDTAETIAQLRSGKAEKLLTEQPVLRSFFITPLKGAESVQDFYETHKQQSELFQEFQATKQKPADFNPALYAKLKSANTQIQELNKSARKIDESKLSPEKKRESLDKINLIVLHVARKAMGK